MSARKPRLPRLSPTKLNTYLTCPRQYFYSYIRKLPRRARSYFSFGTSLHSALQEFHEQGGSRTQEVGALLEGLQNSWVDAGYATPQEQAERFDLGQQLLESYYQAESFRQSDRAPSDTLFMEKTLSTPLDGFVLTGRIDRVDRRPDGLVEVLDYKSGWYVPTQEDLENDLAIAIYQLLVATELRTAPVLGTIYNLRANEAVSIQRDQARLEAVRENVTELFHILDRDEEYVPTPGAHCDHCDYSRYCPVAGQVGWVAEPE